MLFLWFYHACRRNSPRFLMVSDHINYLTFEDPGAVNTVRRALKLAHAGDLYGAAETAGVDVAHAAVVGEGLRRGMRYSIGAEVDNDPRARPDAQNIVDAMRPDGIVRSVHFLTIDHPEKGGEFSWPYDNPELMHYFEAVGVERVWELYAARLIEDVEKLPGHIIGHFYKPAMFGHWPDQAKLEEYEDRLLDAAAARGMAIEINTRPLYRDYPQLQRERYIEANKRLMRKAKSKNVAIAIGSDAHSPKDQGGAFDLVLEMLDDCEINEIVFPVAGRLARVALRATKEHIEKQQKTSGPAQPGSSISGLSRAELGLPEESARAEGTTGSKSGRDAGPKKRASAPARTTKKPEPDEAPAKSTSRRSAQSAASSAKAKEYAAKPSEPSAKPTRAPKVAPAAKSDVVKPVPAKAPKAPAKAKAVAAPPTQATTKAAAKPAPKTTPKPAAKAVAAKAVGAKAVGAKTVAAKTVAAKPIAAKTAAKTAPKPAAKSAGKKTAVKSAAKTVKSAGKASAKKVTVKKTASAAKKAPAKKTPARPSPKAKKPAAKPAAKKTVAKKAATPSKPAKKSAKAAVKKTAPKKKITSKRR